jgi:hypothetical protein
MTTYGDNINNPFYHYVRAGYRYTYALVNYTTGEVRTMSCDHQGAALRELYHIYQGELRSAKADLSAIHLVLANARTGEVLEETDVHFGQLAKFL